ncbi:MAG: phosphatase PAP2 family protein [Gemmatimonadota bacterium]|nr:phosphatase PAP2 family protein [Gemmatimonadota bacterium]
MQCTARRFILNHGRASERDALVSGGEASSASEYGTRAARWFRTLAWHWIAIVAVSMAALVLFALVGEDVFNHESGGVDDAVRSWVLARRTPGGYAAFVFITRAGSSIPMILFAAAVGIWLWHTVHRRIAGVVVTAPAVATGVFNGVKAIFHRARPAGAGKLHVLTYAFPSGHATTSTAVLLTLSYVLARERLIPAWVALVVGTAGPLLVGASRVYLDVHWATDVFGGWALGAFVAALSAALYERVRARVIRQGDQRSVVPLGDAI